MSPTRQPTSRAERMMGLAALLALVLLTQWLWRRQARVHAAVLAAGGSVVEAGQDASRPHQAAALLSNHLPDVFAPLSPIESFGPDDLSDKINGRAELYLAAGFVRLDAQRFARLDDPSLWMEVYVYDMGALPNAFSVHSAQRRENSEPLDLGPLAQRTPNALFLVQGRHYVEMIGSAESAGLLDGMTAFARKMVAGMPSETPEFAEPKLFPKEHLDENSIMMHAANGLGFERFDRLFTATYREGGAELTAFLSARDDAAEAAALAKAFVNYLLENGGSEEEGAALVAGARVINLFGTYDIVFSRGRVVAGVHQAESLELAEYLAHRVSRALSDEP